ncbi:Hypp8215 [Branchiostoma lanceolatum]|uniref:Hypp8215 protein n=1 Tax=Branchiostoma lanceolatum TaxID=7740 RepID=A0A8J9Z680_BRALA|nr:Hypp8215 [Branchiostoma lanceolatum]
MFCDPSPTPVPVNTPRPSNNILTTKRSPKTYNPTRRPVLKDSECNYCHEIGPLEKRLQDELKRYVAPGQEDFLQELKQRLLEEVGSEVIVRFAVKEGLHKEASVHKWSNDKKLRKALQQLPKLFKGTDTPPVPLNGMLLVMLKARCNGEDGEPGMDELAQELFGFHGLAEIDHDLVTCDTEVRDWEKDATTLLQELQYEKEESDEEEEIEYDEKLETFLQHMVPDLPSVTRSHRDDWDGHTHP